jgi:hypothetical protein
MRVHNWIVTEGEKDSFGLWITINGPMHASIGGVGCPAGAPISLLHHSTWEAHFRKYAKMARRRQQHGMTQPQQVVKLEPGALYDNRPMTPAQDDDDDATSDEDDPPSGTNAQRAAKSTSTAEAVGIKTEQQPVGSSPLVDAPPPTADETVVEETVEVKMERVQIQDQADVENSVPTLADPQPPPPVSVDPPIKAEPVRQPPPQTVKPRGTRHDVVDLTGEDDDDEDTSGGHTAVPGPSLHVKREPLAMATSSFVASFGDGEDYIRSAMIHEYNTLNQQVAETDHERAVLSQRAASGSVQDMLACKQQLDQLKNTLIKVAHSRNAAVARLLFYLHGDDSDFAQKVQGNVAADIPDAQAAYHRRLFDLQTTIDTQRGELAVAKRHMDEAVAMKSGPDVYAEVMRLGHEISAKEQQLQTLETQRLDGFLQLAHVSAAVRSAALALVATATAKSSAS